MAYLVKRARYSDGWRAPRRPRLGVNWRSFPDRWRRRREAFDRDLAAETRVHGAIDLAHAAGAQGAEDPVRTSRVPVVSGLMSFHWRWKFRLRPPLPSHGDAPVPEGGTQRELTPTPRPSTLLWSTLCRRVEGSGNGRRRCRWAAL